MIPDDLDGHETLYDYLLSNCGRYVDLIRQGVSHQEMIDGDLLGAVTSNQLLEAGAEHTRRMAGLRRAGGFCRVCEGKPCNIEEVADELASRIKPKQNVDEVTSHDMSTKAGYLMQRAADRHNLTNYDDIITELPSCCLSLENGECDPHLIAYWTIKQAAT